MAHGNLSSLLDFERELLSRGIARAAGIDEVGRGPLAGPVAAAAVVLPPDWIRTGLPSELHGLTDSKRLAPARRERFAAFLLAFTLSWDEFIIAFLLTRFDVTLPVEIWSALRTGLNPVTNAVGSLVFGVSIALVLLVELVLLRRGQPT